MSLVRDNNLRKRLLTGEANPRLRKGTSYSTEINVAELRTGVRSHKLGSELEVDATRAEICKRLGI